MEQKYKFVVNSVFSIISHFMLPKNLLFPTQLVSLTE